MPTPMLTPGLPPPSPTPAAGDICGDGIDNYGDGKVDAEDEQCQRTPYNVPATVSNVHFANNTIVDPYGVKSILSPSPSGFTGYELSNNTYYSSSAMSDKWFKTGSIVYTQTEFLSEFEPTASFTRPEFKDPTRNSLTYAASLGAEDYEEFVELLKEEGRHNWNEEHHAYAINSYIREGFEKN